MRACSYKLQEELRAEPEIAGECREKGTGSVLSREVHRRAELERKLSIWWEPQR